MTRKIYISPRDSCYIPPLPNTYGKSMIWQTVFRFQLQDIIVERHLSLTQYVLAYIIVWAWNWCNVLYSTPNYRVTFLREVDGGWFEYLLARTKPTSADNMIHSNPGMYTQPITSRRYRTHIIFLRGCIFYRCKKLQWLNNVSVLRGLPTLLTCTHRNNLHTMQSRPSQFILFIREEQAPKTPHINQKPQHCGKSFLHNCDLTRIELGSRYWFISHKTGLLTTSSSISTWPSPTRCGWCFTDWP